MARSSALSLKLIVVLGLSVLIVTGLAVAVFFPNLLLPDRLKVDETTSTQDLLERYSILIKAIASGEDFENLELPARQKIMDELEQLNKELAMDINMTEVDPNEPIEINMDAISKLCTENCQTSPEIVNPCEGAGFVFVENLGCISEPIAEIIEIIEITFDPAFMATDFDVLTTITLIDSSGVEFEETKEFDIPLQSLITPSGSLLDLAKVKVSLIGISATDNVNPIQTQGTLNYIINGESIRGIPIVTTSFPNEITGGFDIKINNRFSDTFSFKDQVNLLGLQSGVFANNFKITLRDFKVTQGNSTFFKLGDTELYSLDFTHDKGLETVIGSTGVAQAIPISDGELEFCAQVRNYKPADITYTFLPDRPSSVLVRIQTGTEIDMNANSPTFNRKIPVYLTIIPSFTVNLDNVSTRSFSDYCETRNSIPRSSQVEFVISGLTFGTGGGNQVVPVDKVFKINTPESKMDWFITCTSGDVDFVTHWCNSDIGSYSHSRVSTEFIVSP